MDFFIQYFPLLKVIIFIFFGFLILVLFKQKKPVGAWSIIVFLAIFSIYKPVKLKINTDKINQEHNRNIEQTKVIPPKVEDHSFEEGNHAIKHITQEELK